MARGVFLHREDSPYNDKPDEQYQFPSQYLSRAMPFQGDWVIYYEPRRGPTGKGYFAVARVDEIVRDPSVPGMYLAMIEPGSYFDFERNVPFRDRDGRLERGVPNAQWAVRPISIEDFNRIIERGLPDENRILPRADSLSGPEVGSLVKEEHEPFTFEAERERVTLYTTRAVRDRVFRRRVLEAYDCRCAITGLRFINGGGRAEVQAAHIRPVEHQGPDALINGIALSGTVHWMFDRGLISLSDDLQILVSRQVNDVDSVWKLVNHTRRAAVPGNASQRPHPRFLAWHREHCFKQ